MYQILALELNTNTRHVKISNDFFTVPKTFTDRGESICDFCIMRNFHCRRKENLEDMFKSPIETCPEAILPLTFQSDVGLQFNNYTDVTTLRLGVAWARRLDPLNGNFKFVSLINSRTKSLIGLAKVIHTMVVPRSDVAIASWQTNHMVIDTDMTPDERQEYLNKVVQSYYGGFDRNKDKDYSIITLRRLNEEQEATIKNERPNGGSLD